MQIHTLRPTTKNKKKKRIGRGGKRGTYSGRGQKGQKARSGRRIKPAIREMILRMPKRRGVHFKPFGQKPAIINLGTLDEKYQANETVSPQSLFEKGLVRKIEGKLPRVKILGTGTISKPLQFKNVTMSKSVTDKVNHKS